MNDFWNILASPDSFGLLWLLAIAAMKATLLLAFAALLCLVFRRFSASTRHLLWASILCASLLLPFLSFIKVWEVPVLPARISVSDALGQKESAANDEAFETPSAQGPKGLSFSSQSKTGARQISEFQSSAKFMQAHDTNAPTAPTQKETASLLPRLANCVLAVWAIGVLLILLRLLVGLVATNSLARRAREFKDPALNGLLSSLRTEINLKSSLRLLRSEHTSMPIVCGVLRASILLPAEAWPDERRRMVLLHELTHVARRDCLTQMMAQAACAFYWFNPLIWSAARRLRIEREKACDDYVLSIGTRPSDYAHHLLEIARSMRERSVFKWSQTASVAMARRSQLEGRLLAILSKENKHGAVSRATTFGLVALTCVLLLSLGALRPTLINARNSQTSKTSNDDKEKAQKSLTDSSLTGSEQGINTAVQAAKIREGIRAEEISNAASGHPQEQAVNNNQVNEGIEGNIKRGVEPHVEQNILEVVAQRTATNIQTTEVKTQASTEADAFIRTAYREEHNQQEQDKGVDFIDEMASVGYTNLSIDELIRLKTAGVSAEYVKSLRALGLVNLTTKELGSLSLYGVKPSYIKAIRAAGYNDLSVRELTTFSIHGITPEYIKALRSASYADLPAKQLIEFAIHEVTPSYISGIRAAGYSDVSAKELVALRVFDVTPEFIRKARSRLGELTLKQIISLKSAGIIEDDKDKE